MDRPVNMDVDWIDVDDAQQVAGTGPTVVGHVNTRGARDVTWLMATQQQYPLIVALDLGESRG